jgi:hypothetical protein
LKEVYKNIRTSYNKFAEQCITEDDISRGLDFPESITSTIKMKGLETYFEKDKKEK